MFIADWGVERWLWSWWGEGAQRILLRLPLFPVNVDVHSRHYLSPLIGFPSLGKIKCENTSCRGGKSQLADIGEFGWADGGGKSGSRH